MDNAKASAGKNPGAPRSAPAPAASPSKPAPSVPKAAPLPPPGPLPPLFRRIDWLSFGITFLFVMIGYWFTIAPELTLEDSGELATGAFYAGIPHPPGYPVWTIYSWAWTVILPFKNIAWRVAVGSAFSGAVASGLLALVASRSSSMIIESIDDLKSINRRLENLICLVAGFVAGTLIGFNGYMWSQAVIVEVYALSVLSLMGVVVCLLRWLYAPHQHRYLYMAFFLYGICFNNHQSLLVIAMGMEVLIAMAEPKLGREMFFWNTFAYLIGLWMSPPGIFSNTPVFVIFNVIGVASALVWFWLVYLTWKKAPGQPMNTVGLLMVVFLYIGGLGLNPTSIFGDDSPAILKVIFNLLGLTAVSLWLWLIFIGKKKLSEFAMDVAVGGSIVGLFLALESEKIKSIMPVFGIAAVITFAFLIRRTWPFFREWFISLACGGTWVLGAAFYLYMALAGMSNPPMQWGYPRTFDGFLHAFSRGQYEKVHPTSGEDVGDFLSKYGTQLWRSLEGLNEEFNFLYILIGLVVFLFLHKMKRRERAWVIGMTALFACLGPFLVLLLNFGSDRQSLDLCRVFLTASHVFVAMAVGLGLALLTAALSVHYDSLRKISIMGGICVLDFALFLLAINSHYEFEKGEADRASTYGYIKILCWIAAIICVIILWRKGLERDRLLAVGLPGLFVASSVTLTLIAFFGAPPHFGGLAAGFKETIGAFSPDQYGLPIFASLILIGGAAWFLWRVFRSSTKAPMRTTLVLCALLPSYSILTHWFSNEQRNHYFGYWFGHDMFTPPFIASNGKFSYDAKLREEAMKGTNGALVYPEMARDAILYGGTDPGRFCPTYMIFCDSFLPVRCRPDQDKAFDRRDVYIITQNALADTTYLEYIRAHYNRSQQKIRGLDTPFFQEALRSTEEKAAHSETNFLARMVQPLDRLFTRIGESIEKDRRAGSSCFVTADFVDLESLARKLASQQTALTRQIYKGLSPGTQNLLAGGDRQKLAASLANDLNAMIEKPLYDDAPLTNSVDRRWKALFTWEAAVRELPRAVQYQRGAEVARLQSILQQNEQIMQQCDTNLARETEAVAQYFATNGAPLSQHVRDFIRQAPNSFTRIRLNRLLLEAAFPEEIASSPGGVYPDTEMYIASPLDHEQCFQEYTTDAARRLQHDEQFPREPKQVRPQEYVTRVGDRVQVSGQTAVMTINGLLTKVMFDRNPSNEFYVEESFPLEWMYPHLTPFGVIMKIERQPVPEITEEMVRRDHVFWSKFSERLIGDWITYETPVKEITDFVERVYLQHDFRGFKGDRKFVRDDQAQKAFSKLRSSIATSIYSWRFNLDGNTPPQYLPKSEPERRRMLKEAEFALSQAFAYCPYSPEAVFHYVRLLAIEGRMDDALLVAEACQKLDPYNGQVAYLLSQLRGGPKTRAEAPPPPPDVQIAQLEAEVRANPGDFQKALDLAAHYYRAGMTDRTMVVLDSLLNNPKADVNVAATVASAYMQMNNLPKVEGALEKLLKLAPNQPEFWYSLAQVKSKLNKNADAVHALQQSVDIGLKIRVQNTNVPDYRSRLESDPQFAALRDTSEFKAAFPLK